jgi:predicted transcriptional regulator
MTEGARVTLQDADYQTLENRVSLALSSARKGDIVERQIDAALLEIEKDVEQLSREVESIRQQLAEEVE